MWLSSALDCSSSGLNPRASPAPGTSKPGRYTYIDPNRTLQLSPATRQMEIKLKNLSLKNKILCMAEPTFASISSPEAPRPSLGLWDKLITSSRRRQGLGVPRCQTQLYGEESLTGDLSGKSPFSHRGVGFDMPEAHVFCKEEGWKLGLPTQRPHFSLSLQVGSTCGPGGWESVRHGKGPCDGFHLPRSARQ